MNEAKESSKKRLIWALVFALVLALACARKAVKLDHPDFKVFYTAAQHVWQDPSLLYRVSPDRYLYPPSTAILLSPLALLPWDLARWLWHGALALCLAFLASRSWASFLASLLLTRYLATSFGYGQINLFVLFFLWLAADWAQKKKAGSAALWALATSLKVYPAVLAPLWLLQKRFREFFVGIAAGLLLLLLPYFLFPSLTNQLYGEFFQALQEKGLPLYSHNQSFTAFFQRVFTPVRFYLHAVGPVEWGYISLPPLFLRALAVILGLLLCGLSWWKAKHRDLHKDALSAAAFSILFLSHIVWKDYLLLLYFPLSRIFAVLPKKTSLYFAALVLATVTLSAPDLLGAPIAARLDACSIHLWLAVVVWLRWMTLPEEKT